ncbi:hypothetical protein TNCV_3469871 [Trichonephila clavipes]|nr:hypothetical protein TNCV_3469871 [Trichonephila clavipes]
MMHKKNALVFCQLHRTDPNDKFKVFSPNKHLFVNLLDCVLEARDITSDEGKRYALANNPFIPGFNKHEEESYIIAVDANNLYGYAMSQPLPIGHFFWLTKDEVRNLDVFTLSSTDTVGYF